MALHLPLDWNKPSTRKLTAVLIFVGAVALQFLLANIPVPITLDDDVRFNTLTASLGRHEMILRGLVVEPENRLLLSYSGGAREVVTADFDQAQVGEKTVRMFTSLGQTPPPDFGPLHYTTRDSGSTPSGEICRTFFDLTFQDDPPHAFHFFQLGQPGLGLYRHLEMKAYGTRLLLNANTASPDSANANAAGCGKMLRVGRWSGEVSGVGIQIMVSPGSSFRFNFHRVSSDPPWGGEQGLFESIALGSSGSLQAREVVIQPIPDKSTTMPLQTSVDLRSYGNRLLNIYSLKVGSNTLQVNASGKAWVKKDGKNVGVDIVRLLQENPAVGALLTAANGALLAWLFKSFSKPRQRRRKKAK